MTHAISLTDEQYARLQAAARSANQDLDQVLAGLLNWLPAPSAPLSPDEYERRWQGFWDVVGQHPAR